MCLQREVAGIKKADIRLRNVFFECIRARRQKERIMLAPNGKQPRLVRAEVILESGVQRDVALIVAEEIQLHVIRSGTSEIEVIERHAVRRNLCRIGYP